MNRRRLAIVTLLAAGAAVAGFISLRPEAPVGEVETNSVGVTWVSYDEAVSEPIIDIGLPGGGRLQYPKRTRGPRSSRRFTAGFIQLPSNSSGSLFLPNGDQIHGIKGQLVPVPWASATDRRDYVLKVHHGFVGPHVGEINLKVRAPFDRRMGSAPYGPVRASVGPYEFDGHIDRITVEGVAILRGSLTKAKPTRGRIMSEFMLSSALTYILQEEVHIYGEEHYGGGIVFKGVVAADGLKRTQFRFVVRPTK